MSQTPQPTYLSIERAMEFIGDANGVLSLLKTLQQTLSDDLPRLQELLDKGEVYAANRILHQLKGFTPVFCVDSLVELVVQVEGMSKHAEASDEVSADRKEDHLSVRQPEDLAREDSTKREHAD